ncbi:MAG: alanine racemase [Bdellovibrionales bacterium]
MNSSFKAPFFSRSILEVHLNSLKKNLQQLKSLSDPEVFFCPMVKDEAYGLGAIPVTKALLEEGVRQVGVISIQEARQIREALKEDFGLLVFGPVLDPKELHWAFQNNVTLVVSNWLDLESLKDFSKIRIHLKFDTGFSRLGFACSEAQKIKTYLDQQKNIEVEALCTQLIFSEDQNQFESQVKQLEALRSGLFPDAFLHIFNTAALCASSFNERSKKFSSIGARPGIGLYGIKPDLRIKDANLKKKWDAFSLEMAACLKSYVCNIHHLNQGDRVSYLGTWTAPKACIIATVSLGYGDGFFRSADTQREVLFRGQRAPIVGAVCMDFFMIDVTKCIQDKKEVCLGEEVVIFGRQEGAFLPIEEHAQKSGTIPYELLVRLGPRVQRVYV